MHQFITRNLLYLNLFGFIISVLFSCSSYKAKKQEAELTLPALGTFVKTKGGILYDAAAQIGVPEWKNLKVSVQQLPFNIESYTTYARYMQKAAKINTIPYNDSLRYKPKYIRLHLQDKIGLAMMINNSDHQQIRNYLSLDEGYKLVSSVDLAINEADIEAFLNVDGALLEKDRYENIVLMLYNKGQKEQLYFKDLAVFNYGLSTFCWGTDRYSNLRIENINEEGEKCPKNTYTKASKLTKEKNNLKF